MNKILFALPAMAVISSAAVAADFAPYISLKGSVGATAWKDAEVNPAGFGFAPAVGVRMKTDSINMRGEFEYASQNLKAQKTKDYNAFSYTLENQQKVQTYLANFYVDFLEEYRLKPYVGLNFGMMNIKEDVSLEYTFWGNHSLDYTTSVDGSYNSFIWGFNGGFSWNFTDGLQGDLGAGYKFTTVEQTPITMFDLTIGLRYTF